MEFKEVDCPQCGGTGVHERECRVCGGRSSENCDRCHGTGCFRFVEEYGNFHPHNGQVRVTVQRPNEERKNDETHKRRVAANGAYRW